MKPSPCLSLVILFALIGLATGAEQQRALLPPADQMLAESFRAETAKLTDRCLADVKSLEDWNNRRGQYREQLFDMLGLTPLPARGDLKASVTSRVERDDFVVENLHFQSSPGLYVTANLYLPKHLTKPAPTILYLSGHGPVISNGVSYGNKVSYQHHGAWFARNGYICLVLDTLQLGEILGLHHGTYREGLWWWNSRGYTPAGVEAWNCIRALDYLSTRPEVDANRFGATGRSGGGAYSWWIAALDDRIKVAAPVAGITDLENHVVDGTVEGHCDCMFTVNTYRWDYAQVAALVAPRPLLIVNTDSDSIFPLDGVVRLHKKVRDVYDLHRASDKLGLVIGPGPHKDTQDLQVPVFRWFNKHLKGEDPIIEMAAVKLLTPQDLKVFNTLPSDAINTNIHDVFVPAASAPALPASGEEWQRQQNIWMAGLKEKAFAGWPKEKGSLQLDEQSSVTHDDLRLRTIHFDSDSHTRLRLYLLTSARAKRAAHTSLQILDDTDWKETLSALATIFGKELSAETAHLVTEKSRSDATDLASFKQRLADNQTSLAFFAPRGIGLNEWNNNPRKQVQIRRRFMLLGQTLDSMRVWDIRRACDALRLLPFAAESRLEISARRSMSVNVAFASLFETGIDSLTLTAPPSSLKSGPDYLNVLRVLDMPAVAAMAASRSKLIILTDEVERWDYPTEVARRLGWNNEKFRVQSLESRSLP